jgi:hypothetical protein
MNYLFVPDECHQFLSTYTMKSMIKQIVDEADLTQPIIDFQPSKQAEKYKFC